MNSRRLRFLVLPVVLALFLGACGSDDGGGDDATPDESASASPSPSESASDDGMTEPGTELGLGETATVTWRPKAGLSGVATVSVDRMDQVPIKAFSGFQLDAQMRQSTPYYVNISVRNDGNTDLSGVIPPLYLDNGSDVLHPPADITSSFKPCPSRGLPKGFTQGKTAKLCLVFLAPAKSTLEAIALRASETVEPITWTGAITKPAKPKKKPAKKKN